MKHHVIIKKALVIYCSISLLFCGGGGEEVLSLFLYDHCPPLLSVLCVVRYHCWLCVCDHYLFHVWSLLVLCVYRYQCQAELLGLSGGSAGEEVAQGTKLSPKLRFSTPLLKHSICMEIKDMVGSTFHRYLK